jgi:hypothetical protein
MTGRTHGYKLGARTPLQGLRTETSALRSSPPLTVCSSTADAAHIELVVDHAGLERRPLLRQESAALAPLIAATDLKDI